MAGRVTALTYQKLRTGRVNLELDGEFALALPDIIAARLQVGQYLSDADIAGLRGLDEEQKAYERAVRFLAFRPRSEAELRRNLERAGLNEELVGRVVERLRGQGYVNDEEFSRFWIENRQQFKPRAPRALRQELRSKGIDAAMAAAMVENLDPVDAGCRAARPQAQRLAAVLAGNRCDFRRRLAAYLARRGFEYPVVRQVIARLESELAKGATKNRGLEAAARAVRTGRRLFHDGTGEHPHAGAVVSLL